MEFYESVQGYIATECPICGTRLILRPEQAGSTLKCEMCYHQLKIPKEIRVRPKPKPVLHQVEAYPLREEEPPPDVAGEREADPSAGALPAGRAGEGVLPAPRGPRSGDYDLVPSDNPPVPPKAEERSADVVLTSDPPPTSPPSRVTASPRKEAADTPRRRKEAFAVVCPKCTNRMYARLHQVGEQIACGDCGYVLVVPEAPAEAPKKALPRPEPVPLSAEEPPATAEPPRPPPQRSDGDASRELGAARAGWRTEPLKWTFFSGVVSFLWVGAGPMHWVVVTAALFLVGEPVAAIYQAITTGGLYLLIVSSLILLLGGFLTFVGPYAAGCFWNVMHATANGATDLVDWPEGAWGDHLGQLWRVTYHSSLSLGLAYGSGLAASNWFGPAALPIVACITAVLLFPLVTISSLESQRTIWPFSAVVCGSLWSLWWGWLLMYLEIAALLAIWAVTVVFTIDDSPYLTVFWSSPILGAVALISARLFGRLIWRATCRDADDEAPRPTVYERVVRSRPEGE